MRLLVSLALLALAPTSMADTQGDWAKSFEHRAAVLKIDLPTLDPDHVGLLVFSSVRGAYYAFDRFFDRSPEQLLTKILADRESGDSIRWTGSLRPRLTLLKAGSAVTIKSIELRDRMAVIWIWDEFARTERSMSHHADIASTSFSIEWPNKWSKDFHERGALETAMTQALTW